MNPLSISSSTIAPFVVGINSSNNQTMHSNVYKSLRQELVFHQAVILSTDNDDMPFDDGFWFHAKIKTPIDNSTR